MDYFEFLMIFVGFPLVVLVFLGRRLKRLDRTLIIGIFILCLIALFYTTPWDNYLIMRGVWSYPEGAVLGTLGFVPLEEYGFMILQTGLAGALFALLVRKVDFGKLSFRPLGFLPAFLIGVLGLVCLSYEKGTYAGLILVWAFPPLALQWSLGGRLLRDSFSTLIVPWAVLTLYLCLADSYAISEGIWSLNPKTRSGLDFGNLPIEEALFFACTNLFVIQGLCLWQAWKRGPS
jgi:lycopene cyclase domain-containing protein